MGALMAGYVFSQINIEQLQEAIEKAAVDFVLKEHPLVANHGINPFLNVEIKELENGLFLDTKFEIINEELIAISKYLETRILRFIYVETSMTFLCFYIKNGVIEMELMENERRRFEDNITLEKYKNLEVDLIIMELFKELTGEGLLESMDTDGELYYFDGGEVIDFS